MDKVTISNRGLEAFDWDGDLRGDCRRRINPDKTVSFYLKETGEVLVTAPTTEEAEQFFYKPALDNEEMEVAVLALKDVPTIEPGTTIKDVLNIIHTNPALENVCVNIFKNYKVISENLEKLNEFSIICRKIGYIKNGVLKIHYVAQQSFEHDVGILTVDDNFVIKDDSFQTVCEGQDGMSLYDILMCLFDSEYTKPCLYFKPEGLFFENGESVDDPFQFLLNPVVISDDLKLIDVFNYVAKNEALMGFISVYSSCWYIDEYHKEAEDFKDSDNLLHLLIERSVLLKDENYLNPDISFMGIGKPDEYGGYRYGIEFSNCGTYSHLPIKIEQPIEIIAEAVYSRSMKTFKKPQETLKTVSWDISLLEFLDAIYWEISFCGKPEERDAKLGDLNERVEEVKSGEVKTIDLETLFKELEEEENEDDGHNL